MLGEVLQCIICIFHFVAEGDKEEQVSNNYLALLDPCASLLGVDLVG